MLAADEMTSPVRNCRNSGRVLALRWPLISGGDDGDRDRPGAPMPLIFCWVSAAAGFGSRAGRVAGRGDEPGQYQDKFDLANPARPEVANVPELAAQLHIRDIAHGDPAFEQPWQFRRQRVKCLSRNVERQAVQRAVSRDQVTAAPAIVIAQFVVRLAQYARLLGWCWRG